MEELNKAPWALLVKEIFKERKVDSDVIFVHGWADLNRESIQYVSNLKKQSKAKYILLNGSKEYERMCPGFEYWKEKLIALGIKEEEIIATKPALNTQEEARELINFLKVKKLKTSLIYSVPQHIMRAFLTNLGVMEASNLKFKLYPSTLKGVNFDEPITIKPLANKTEETTRLGRFAEEIIRIINYRKEYEIGDANFTISSVQRGLEYLQKLE